MVGVVAGSRNTWIWSKLRLYLWPRCFISVPSWSFPNPTLSFTIAALQSNQLLVLIIWSRAFWVPCRSEVARPDPPCSVLRRERCVYSTDWHSQWQGLHLWKRVVISGGNNGFGPESSTNTTRWERRGRNMWACVYTVGLCTYMKDRTHKRTSVHMSEWKSHHKNPSVFKVPVGMEVMFSIPFPDWVCSITTAVLTDNHVLSLVLDMKCLFVFGLTFGSSIPACQRKQTLLVSCSCL